jgi:hypothetical protein
MWAVKATTRVKEMNTTEKGSPMPKTWQRGLFNHCPGRKPGIGSWGLKQQMNPQPKLLDGTSQDGSNKSDCNLSDGTLRSEPSQPKEQKCMSKHASPQLPASKRMFTPQTNGVSNNRSNTSPNNCQDDQSTCQHDIK